MRTDVRPPGIFCCETETLMGVFCRMQILVEKLTL